MVLAEMGKPLFSCPKSIPFPDPPLLSSLCFHLSLWWVSNFMMKFGELALEEPEASHGVAQTLGTHQREAGPALAMINGPGARAGQRVHQRGHRHAAP